MTTLLERSAGIDVTPVVRLVTCGSVDDGKSTLIGRLLAETGSIPADLRAPIAPIGRGPSRRTGGSPR